MNVLLLLAHSIAEYDDVRMLHDLGYNVLSIGAYLDPANPSDDKRPALPGVPPADDRLRALVADQMVAKSNLPDEVLEWADVAIIHHFPDQAPDGRPGWITGNWRKFREHGVRVIWRTCGQSHPMLEALMGQLRPEGLQIVRYSPKESAMPYYAGADTLIRFGKYPADYGPWIGDDVAVGNVTQNMVDRGDACGYDFWRAATEGLRVKPAGPGSEHIGGVGELTYEQMLDYLRHLRAYLYTGTVAAPYTLGLMEAMLTGVPVVSIGPNAWNGPAELFEGADIVGFPGIDTADNARTWLRVYLDDVEKAREEGVVCRQRAIELFDVTHVGPQWREFLG